jgi:hypothetical protein
MAELIETGAMAVELLARVHAEIERRLVDLRPAVEEYEQLIGAADLLETDPVEGAEPRKPPAGARPARGAASTNGATRRRAPAAPKRAARARAPRRLDGAAEQAIVAALEHGSHTVAELVLVSALPAADIRAGLRALLKAGTVTRARREGRAAYALSSAV